MRSAESRVADRSKSRPRKYWHIGLLLLVSVASLTRLWELDALPYAIFDERQYATMAAQYLANRPFVDIHPPVARFHFAAAASLAGASPHQRFPDILAPYGDFPYVALRAVSAIAGIALVLFVALVTKEITSSLTAGLLAGLLVTFDNTLVLNARLILPDTLLLMYGTAGLWCFLKKDAAPERSFAWYSWFAAAILLFALAAGTKITGFLFPAAALFQSLLRPPAATMSQSYKMVAYLLFVPFLLSSVFILAHFLFLAPGGSVYSTITDMPISMFDTVRKSSFPLVRRMGEVVLAQLIIIDGGVTDAADKATASPAWYWPFMQKPMTFAIFHQAGLTRALYFIGNPIIWWGGLGAVIYAFIHRTRRHVLYAKSDILLFGYLFYIIVMALVQRPLFLYHYLPALVFLIMITAAQLERICRHRPALVAAVVALVIASFLYIAPYTYGSPLTPRQLEVRTAVPFLNPLLDQNLQIL